MTITVRKKKEEKKRFTLPEFEKAKTRFGLKPEIIVVEFRLDKQISRVEGYVQVENKKVYLSWSPQGYAFLRVHKDNDQNQENLRMPQHDLIIRERYESIRR